MSDHHRTHGHTRSGHWPAVERAHLETQPDCQVCGGRQRLNVHHIRPFHLFPEHELDPKNLITLCDGEVVNCHLLFGHLRDWRAWNPHVVQDAETWRRKILRRRAA